MKFIANEIASMMETFKNGKLKRDIYRQIAMFLLALFALIPMWDASQVVLYFIGVTALFGMGVHLLRIIFFPNISMDAMAEKAKETPAGAAAIFVSLTFFICTLSSSHHSLLGSSNEARNCNCTNCPLRGKCGR